MRSYIVIPEGTPVLRVQASTPHYAASKAKRGKAEHVEAAVLVVPASAVIDGDRPAPIHPQQLQFENAA